MAPSTPAQKGLLTGGLMIAASALSLFVLKNPVESNFQFIVYAFFCAGIVWSLFTYSKSVAEAKAFKDYFSVGFKTFVVITLLMAVFAYIYFSFNTGFRDEKIAENNRLLLLQGDHLPNEIEAQTAQLKKMYLPLMVSATVFRYLILGVLVTAITAAFLSQKNKAKQL